MSRIYYCFEQRSMKNGQWYRDEAEYDSIVDLRADMSERIYDAGDRWRIVEVKETVTVVSSGRPEWAK
jgi:hypothetical protein